MKRISKSSVVHDEKDWFVGKVGVAVRTDNEGVFCGLSLTIGLSYTMEEHESTARLGAVDEVLRLMAPGLFEDTPLLAKFVVITERIDHEQRHLNAERSMKKLRKPLTWWQRLCGYHYPEEEEKEEKYEKLMEWFLDRVLKTEGREDYAVFESFDRDLSCIRIEKRRSDRSQGIELKFERPLLERSLSVEVFEKDPKKALERLQPYIEALEKGGIHNYGITHYKLLRAALTAE